MGNTLLPLTLHCLPLFSFNPPHSPVSCPAKSTGASAAGSPLVLASAAAAASSMATSSPDGGAAAAEAAGAALLSSPSFCFLLSPTCLSSISLAAQGEQQAEQARAESRQWV